MKRILLFSLSVMISGILLAGGIVTNQNHSAMYTRMLARDATLGIDAVFYNPAGLTLLPNNGFYLSVNNQSLFQTRTVKTNYYNLSYNTDRSVSPYYEYTGEIQAPLFPGIYAAYVMDNWAFSVGFNPIGGGGGGTYETGLPSFEYSISDLVPALAEMGATAYSMDAYFEGLAAYFGYQANVSYKFNDKLSVALGGRLVMAKEAYNGYIRDVSVIMGGEESREASDIFSGLATQASDGATLATGAATDINNAISGGFIGGSDPLADPTAIGTLTAFGLYTPGMTNDQAVAAFTGLATELTGQAAVATGTANVLQDQEADYEKQLLVLPLLLALTLNQMINGILRLNTNTGQNLSSPIKRLRTLQLVLSQMALPLLCSLMVKKQGMIFLVCLCWVLHSSLPINYCFLPVSIITSIKVQTMV
jgi:hypothetical protein